MKEFELEHLYNNFKNSSGISTDSRKLEEGSIFFALQGKNFNGNKFAFDAIEKGASFVVADDPSLKGMSEKIIYVKDSLKALQDLARHHRLLLKIPVVGLTGSNGKTTTKNLIERVLSIKFKVRATQGNLNNHIGVPISVLSIKEDDEIAVIEMGASGVGEIELLSSICRPTVGLITNISNAHVGGFGNLEGVIRGKSELFDFILKSNGDVIINDYDDIVRNFAKRFNKPIHIKGEGSIVDVKMIQANPQIKFEVDGRKAFTCHLFGEYNFQNILFALSVAKYFGIEEVDSAEVISQYSPQNNRSEKIEYKSNCIVLDAYNANPESMKNAISSVINFPNKNKVFILGDMNELGSESEREHVKIGEILQKYNTHHCFFVGMKMKEAHKKKTGSVWVSDLDGLRNELKKITINNSDILIKGSRSLQLEGVLDTVKQISI